MNPEFPSNSERSKRNPQDDKNISSVVSGSATRRKKSFRKQFKETFVAGDFRTTVHYVLFDVLLPNAQDAVIEGVHLGFEKLIRGDVRRRGSTPPQSGPYGNVNYTRYSGGGLSGPQRALSRQARAGHNFDEIVLDQRTEAEQVIDRLYDLVSRYESASVADLYELVGLGSAHTDNRWGWTDLAGAGVSKVRGGYLLDLPEPRYLG
jgi:hypothetical protein